MQNSQVLLFTFYIFASHYLHLGISKQHSNLFIYPPDYVKADAPRQNKSGEMICIVKINLELWSINEISLQRQDLEVDLTLTVWWEDHRLILSPNISSKSSWPVIDKREAMQIWTPTISLRNCKGCLPVSFSRVEDLYVNKETSLIIAQTRLLRKFTCAINLRAYPMDIQFCQIQLYTFEDMEDAIQLQHLYPDKKVNMDSNLTLGEYDIAPIIKTSCIVKDAEGEVYSCLELRIRLEHLVAYHLMILYAPTSFMVFLSWISFWLPLDLAPARIALGLTTLLTLATRLDQAQKNLPSVSYAKAIDVWMFACIFLVSSSLCEFAISHYRQETRVKVEPKIIKVQSVAVKENKVVCGTVASSPQCSNQSTKYRGTSLDRISRIIFPLAFLLFNIVYWSCYLSYYK